MCAPGGLRLKKAGFRFQRLRGWEGVGETLTTGAGEGKGDHFPGVDTMEVLPVF